MTQNVQDDRNEYSTSDGRTRGPQSDPSSSATERRRRFLTAGLAGGSVLLVSRPVVTLAGYTSATRYCSYSGMQSAATSHTQTLTCNGGKSPGYYKTTDHWPTGPLTLQNGVTVTPNSKFSDVFGAGPSGTLIYILNNQENTDEFHWIAALLNAFGSSQFGLNFPYSPDQVVSFYTNPGLIDPTLSPPPTRHQVARFFADNFENL